MKLVNFISKNKKVLGIIALAFALVGCDTASHQDLRDFMDETKRRPPGKVPEPPRFEPYKPFVYDANRLRSPFQPPSRIETQVLAEVSNVKPDLQRQRQRLESFEFASLSMVGTLEQSGTLWALIRDPDGTIERVREGSFLGKNHGRITQLTEQQIDVVEIVPNGVNGWLERPNVISLNDIQ